jgi:raffinose/stachyose/melibiose transport system substrate-binding protein
MKRHLAGALLALTTAAFALPRFAQDLSFWSWRQEDKATYD